MSLSLRINLILTLLLIVVFYIAAIVTGNNIQSVILKEVENSGNSALTLISDIAVNPSLDESTKRKLIIEASSLIGTQILQVDYYGLSGRTNFTASASDGSTTNKAPQWFVNLVSIESSPFFETFLPNTIGSRIRLVINPTEKIEQAWQNAKPLLLLAALFAGLCYLLVYLSVKSALKPALDITKVLDALISGNYTARVPNFRSPELRNITDKINSVAETIEAARDLEKNMAQQAVFAQEQERRYLARELHDELGQSISAIKAIAVNSACDDPEKQISNRKVIEKLCDRIYAVVHRLMRRLRPVALEELGLVVALRQMVDDWNDNNSEVFCKLTTMGDLEIFSDESAIHIYRVVQEGLTNISKHSNATEVEVHLQHIREDQQIRLKICDNGQTSGSIDSSSRFGLRGIRERIDALGGKVIIEASSRGNKGYTIDCLIPTENIVNNEYR